MGSHISIIDWYILSIWPSHRNGEVLNICVFRKTNTDDSNILWYVHSYDENLLRRNQWVVIARSETRTIILGVTE